MKITLMKHKKAQELPNNLIALLATGDEISNGDILNTNSQEIAYRLFNHGMTLGMQMVTGDSITLIEEAIRYLLSLHRVVIITGGLGPTSDDLTRYALSNALKQPLVFNEDTWHSIETLLKSLGYAHPPDTNRQQALFPHGATIIPNANGTASGCMIKHQDQWIFMLPGPPRECLPMIDHVVIPTLKENQFQKILYHDKWLLFGVSEGEIAEKLDAIAKPFKCLTGYRLWYPYIEFKIYSDLKEPFDAVVSQIEKAVYPYLIDDGKRSASDLLKEKISASRYHFQIKDEATGGLLASVIKTPKTYSYLNFSDTPSPTDIPIKISGLHEYWEEKNSSFSFLEIIFQENPTPKKLNFKIPFRGMRVKQYAVELICKEILNYKFL